MPNEEKNKTEETIKDPEDKDNKSQISSWFRADEETTEKDLSHSTGRRDSSFLNFLESLRLKS